MWKSILLFSCVFGSSLSYPYVAPGFYESIPYSGRSDFFRAPPFFGGGGFGGSPMAAWPFAPQFPLGFRFPLNMGYRPIRFSGWTRKPYGLNGGDIAQIVEIMEAMNLTQSDYDEVMDAAYHWNFTEIYDFVYAKSIHLPPKQRNQALRLIEEYGPPLSFIEAASALTLEQKAHIEELAHSNNPDIDRICSGLIASIPYEAQHQARKFVSLVRYVFGGL